MDSMARSGIFLRAGDGPGIDIRQNKVEPKGTDVCRQNLKWHQVQHRRPGDWSGQAVF